MPKIPQELQEFADSLAELRVATSSAALSTIDVMIINLLIRKGIITRDELLQQISETEKSATQFRATAPDSSEAILALCLRLRHVFGPSGGSGKAS